MVSFGVSSQARNLSRLAAVAFISAGIAGCSSDIGRFNSNPFTGSVAVNTPPAPVSSAAPAPTYSAPVARVETQPLPNQQVASLPPPPAAYPAPRASAPPPVPHAAAAPAPQHRVAGGVHVVGSGDTLSSLGRRYGKLRTEIARANGIAPTATLHIGQRLTIPGVGAERMRTAAHVAPAPAPVAAAPAPVRTAAKPAAPPVATVAAAPRAPVQRTAAVEPTETARLATPTIEAAADAKDAPSATGASASFRWPVRGRVIAGFGAKPNGQRNDGINLAVPEGTSIKAAEDGVVAYAGNELKGYGNLVLVRHPSGYVTAYAHASELKVRRGEAVKRGQIIALAGQTGSVSSPQLHFEVRKGSTPVDPTQLMAAN